jgi:hypothetical protein
MLIQKNILQIHIKLVVKNQNQNMMTMMIVLITMSKIIIMIQSHIGIIIHQYIH